ncbi:MAG TPA: hypothetical protein VHX68_01515 [Planctomycetaceae bacterium]|jgi:hypothetical protein|nr:hypothetical protein [Planctomycetaceae bacterium]
MWKDVVRNMPTAIWTVRVSTADQPEVVHEVPLAETAETDGLIIATTPPCHVRVADVSTPPTRLRITAASNHALVEILEGAVSCYDHPLSQRVNRFDWMPLSFGQTTVTLNFRNG